GERKPREEGPVGVSVGFARQGGPGERRTHEADHAVLVFDETEGGGIAEEEVDTFGIVLRADRGGDDVCLRRRLHPDKGVNQFVVRIGVTVEEDDPFHGGPRQARAAGFSLCHVYLDGSRPPRDPATAPQTASAVDDDSDAKRSALVALTGRPDALDQLEPLLERFAGSAGRTRWCEVGCLE